MSNSTSNLSEEASVSSGNRVHDFGGIFIHNNNPVLVSTFSDHNNHSNINDPHDQQPQKIKKKRSLPGNPDPDAEVIALSPKTLLATNRFVCEICNKGFQRDQNLQLHRRGHNLPWKLKQRNSKEIKKRAYVCPEPTCVHHHPSRALGDLTGIKKHYCRKHGEKKWKCEKCSKIYAVQSDWKAHSKTCGTREYRCDCGTLFSRKDSFITHRAFCDALAEESARLSAAGANPAVSIQPLFPFSTVHHHHNFANPPPPIHIWDPPPPPPPSHHNPNPSTTPHHHHQPPPLLHVIKPEAHHFAAQAPPPPLIFQDPPPPQPRAEAEPRKGLIASPFQALHVSSQNAATSPHLSATALLQKAATVGAVATGPAHHQGQYSQSVGHVTDFGRPVGRHVMNNDQFLLGRTGLTPGDLATWRKSDRLTRDFLGLTADGNSSDNNTIGRGDHGRSNLGNGAVNVSVNVKDMLTYAGGVEFVGPCDQRDHNSLLKPQVFGFAEAASQAWADC
ncbi:TFIIH C1-like domain containing protein [Trema orientale]|uniref:TFIIH C1-like domain containing protein n=1 Tax=Trema orientale TaxID=63057 RepID=A0A2P5FB11_TREOI|nr:TFIIH C1-like domain containing protein [Trema orientale]